MILKEFEQVVQIEQTCIYDRSTQLAPITQYPLQILALSERFDIKKIVRLALHVLTTCHSSQLESDIPTSLSIKIYRYMWNLRIQRVTWYQNQIKTFTEGKLPLTISPWLHNKPASASKAPCSTCDDRRAVWIYQLMLTAQKTPNWNEFSRSFNNYVSCCTDWPRFFEKNFKSMSDVVETWEKTIPNLPE